MRMKKLYYTMKPEDFKAYLLELKNRDTTIILFNEQADSYFYYKDEDMENKIIRMHKLQQQLDLLFNSFDPYQKRMIEQTFFLDEIQSTNSTENIYSTRSDIFGILKEVKQIRNKKIVSISNAYMNMKQVDIQSLYSLEGYRFIYDTLMEHAYDSVRDKPDGKFFRKRRVHISNGLKSVHEGFFPEQCIEKGMLECIAFVQKDMDEYLKLILSHFMIETIHPFYDGNGRFGRYLMSICLLNWNQTIFSYCLSISINKHKKEYYDALKIARDLYEFGCLNAYVSIMMDILLDGIQNIYNDLFEKRSMLEKNYLEVDSLTKSEREIYNVIQEASVLTYFGISNEDIMDITNVSKRTLLSTLKKFRENDLLVDMKFGKVQYHKLKGNWLLEDD